MANRTGLVICDILDPMSHELSQLHQSILKNTINKANKEFGYYALAASNWNIIYQNSYRELRNDANYTLSKMKPIGDYNMIIISYKQQGQNVNCSLVEFT